MATRGTCAATGDPRDRVSEQFIAERHDREAGILPPRLGEHGYVEGQNVHLAFRWAEGGYDRLPALAAELFQNRVNVIAASGGLASALAAKTATDAIPIVFIASDPVRSGLVASLNRPSANLTGVSPLSALLTPLLQTTRTVPVVFVNVTDPVVGGFVESPARPGGNATGLGRSSCMVDLMNPDPSRMAYLAARASNPRRRKAGSRPHA